MASIQASRFALLKIDDDIDDDNKSKGKQNDANKTQQQATKKRNRKKKKSEHSKAENDELRNMAFGGGKASGGKKRTTPQGGAAVDAVPDKQWEQWNKKDEVIVDDEYEKCLQQALLASRLELEEKKEVLGAVAEQNGTTEKKGRKKKKDNKPAPMSLEEFKQMPEPKQPGSDSDSDEEIVPARPQLVTEISEPDPTFFDEVQKDVAKTLRKERMQEKFQQDCGVQNVLRLEYDEELVKKDALIKEQNRVHTELKNELKQARDRNQQLCQILSQGEMKSKAAVLTELDECRRLQEELNQEVATLTQSLEQERSKVHALTAELNNKQKGGKHAK